MEHKGNSDSIIVKWMIFLFTYTFVTEVEITDSDWDRSTDVQALQRMKLSLDLLHSTQHPSTVWDNSG